ncbi:MAG TPA: myxococcus cysteine-rich repeat containing protein [Thermoanaerobaculia bacterium]|nr:myxococcus cysteine-rich repeat containing protein [Thermoanaerobaculia bacterium]
MSAHRASPWKTRVACLAILFIFPIANHLAAASGVIIYPVNPEGILIASISGLSPEAVEIFDGVSFLRYSTAENYDTPISLTPGRHVIGVNFNGITLERAINLAESEVRILTIVFPREEFDIAGWIDEQKISSSQVLVKSLDITAPGEQWFDSFYGTWEVHLHGLAATGGIEVVPLLTKQQISYRLTSRDFEFSLGNEIAVTSFQDSSVFLNTLVDPLLSRSLDVQISERPFTNWYLQYRKNPGYPEFPHIQFSGGSPFLASHINALDGEGDSMDLIAARISFSSLRFRIPRKLEAEGLAVFSSNGTCCPASNSNSELIYGNLDYIKMSSMPYDILGAGIPLLKNCGNGVLDPGEECDDGNRKNGDCCSVTCGWEPSGSSCGRQDACVQDACDEHGHCIDGNHLICDDGKFCNGEEICNPAWGCHSGSTPFHWASEALNLFLCEEGDPCTINFCNWEKDECESLDIPDCSSGQFDLPLPVPIRVTIPSGRNIEIPIPNSVPPPFPVLINYLSTSEGYLTAIPILIQVSVPHRVHEPEAASWSVGSLPPLSFGVATQPAQLWYLNLEGDPALPMTLTFFYNPSFLRAGVNESELIMYKLTEAGWAPVPGVIDPIAKTITITTDSLSIFCLGAMH